MHPACPEKFGDFRFTLTLYPEIAVRLGLEARFISQQGDIVLRLGVD